MPKTFTDAAGRALTRHALNGPTMGTRWSALFYAAPGFDAEPLRAAMAAAVTEVDCQMSVWKPDSDLNRLNRAAPEQWLTLPAQLMEVLETGLGIGRASGGAFDIGLGDAVTAWGFGPAAADPQAIAAARKQARVPAHKLLELDLAGGRARKHGTASFDLNGIAKGYGVDRLAAAASAHGLEGALLAIDGELRALGSRPDGSGWPVAVEAPMPGHRAVHSVLALADAAVATSGNYRHYVDLGDRRLGHTIDPRTGAPLATASDQVTVLAQDGISADAWATALTVMPPDQALRLAATTGLSALILGPGRGLATGTFAAPARPDTRPPSTLPAPADRPAPPQACPQP